MSATLLAHNMRKAAHGRHTCRECRKAIAAREVYVDQRIATDGTVYTYRAHERCWLVIVAQVWDLEGWNGDINDVLDGHTYECAGATKPNFDGCNCPVGEA